MVSMLLARWAITGSKPWRRQLDMKLAAWRLSSDAPTGMIHGASRSSARSIDR